jgi:hypothetical protein
MSGDIPTRALAWASHYLIAGLLLLYSFSWVLAFHESFETSAHAPRIYLIVSSVVFTVFLLYSISMRIASAFLDAGDVSLFLNGLLCACFSAVLVVYSIRTLLSLIHSSHAPSRSSTSSLSTRSSFETVEARRNAVFMVVALSILFVTFLARFVAMTVMQFGSVTVLGSSFLWFDVTSVIVPTTVLWSVVLTLVLLTILASSSKTRESKVQKQFEYAPLDDRPVPKIYANI